MTFRATFGTPIPSGEPRPSARSRCADAIGRVSLRLRRRNRSFRQVLRLSIASAGLFVAFFAVGPVPLLAQHPHTAPPAPHESVPSHPQAQGNHPSQNHPNQQSHPPGQQHLNEWLQHNKGLSQQQQAQKLRQEQGFTHLPPQQQQQLTNRLQQLNRMPAEQRQRTLEMVENMERLSPGQQQQVRGSAARLGQMSPARQQVVKDAMRSLRNVPPDRRLSELASPRYNQLNPEERGVVGNLLTVEPYHPPLPPQ